MPSMLLMRAHTTRKPLSPRTLTGGGSAEPIPKPGSHPARTPATAPLPSVTGEGLG
jgi:hypothetical protein